MFAYIFDTETTGFKEPQIIQAASCSVSLNGEVGKVRGRFYRPTKPIEFGAMATHHILEQDLTMAPLHTTFVFGEFCPDEYVIGHNVDYDWEVAGRPNVKRICTLAIARVLWPELDSHSQNALLYFALGYKAKGLVEGAHDAAIDVQNLTVLWQELFFPAILHCAPFSPTWEDIWAFSEQCRIPRVMAFGKHKGERIEDVPLSYMQWYLRQDETDPYLVKAFEQHMRAGRRA